jgi:hypothetical protein
VGFSRIKVELYLNIDGGLTNIYVESRNDDT